MRALSLLLVWISIPIHRTKLIDDGKSPNPKYRGLIHGSAAIVREEGLRGIYRGLFPVVSPIFFLCFDEIHTDAHVDR